MFLLNKSFSKYPSPNNKLSFETKPLFRGTLHLFWSVLLPLFIIYTAFINYTIFFIWLSCVSSATYHYTDAKKYRNFAVFTEYLDYSCIGLLIMGILFDNYTLPISCVIIPFILEGISYIYQYIIIKNKTSVFLKQLPHIIFFIITLTFIDRDSLYIYILYLLSCFYFVSFSLTNESSYLHITDNIWSGHETFHVFLSIAEIISIRHFLIKN